MTKDRPCHHVTLNMRFLCEVLERLGSTSLLSSISRNHSITEQFGLERGFRSSSSTPPWPRAVTFHLSRCSKPHPIQPWMLFRDGASPASPSNLFQCLTTFIMNNFLLISKLKVLQLYQFDWHKEFQQQPRRLHSCCTYPTVSYKPSHVFE